MNDLALICDAAREAGALALKARREGLRTWAKADGSPVSSGDIAVDALLTGRLRQARPDYGWLSEETADTAERLGRQTLFMVDPIDGTRAYVQGRAWFTVCIAVVRGGRPAAGVVYAPELDELYEAALGGGARLNGRAIRASETADLEDCDMVGDPRMFDDRHWPTPWPAMNVKGRNSIAYRMALVAGGTFDAAVALTPKSEWDVAAADLIVSEAGAVATDHLGRPFTYNKPVPVQSSLVCAAPAIHPLILQRVGHIAPTA
jgi:myo-inositol-1(or 4)-monophosphatase